MIYLFVTFKCPTELILHLAGGLLDIGCGLCGERPDLCVSGARRGARMELYQNSRNWEIGKSPGPSRSQGRGTQEPRQQFKIIKIILTQLKPMSSTHNIALHPKWNEYSLNSSHLSISHFRGDTHPTPFLLSPPLSLSLVPVARARVRKGGKIFSQRCRQRERQQVYAAETVPVALATRAVSLSQLTRVS